MLASVVGAVLLAAPAAGLPLAASPALEAGDLRFPGHDRVAHLDAYREPITAVGYVHGVGATVEVPLQHVGGGAAVTVTAVDPFPELLGMLEVEAVSGLPARLEPGEATVVSVRARFGNCRYYTERAVNVFRGADVTLEGGAGATTVTTPYPTEVVLRSPTILGCPDRVLDRSARQRMLARDE
ncbi:MAG: hypothetical protein WEB09_03550 [Nitriliruptor sp.]